MPFYQRQETEFYCGPAVVQMVLAKVGIVFTQQQLASELKTTPEVGTTANAIVALLGLHGLAAVRHNGASLEDIRAALTKNKTVIVGYIEQGGEPHYTLVSSVTDKTIVLADPLLGKQHMLPLAGFEERWRDNEAGVYGERLLITVA